MWEETMVEDPNAEMLSDTSKEIWEYAIVPNIHDLDEDREEDDGDTSLEQDEDWNGERISIDEMAHTAEHGFHDNNIGRQMALSEGERHEAERAAWQQERDALMQQNSELQYRADPGLQQRAAQQREELTYNIISNPDAVLNHVAGLEQRLYALDQQRQNASLNAAARDYGDEFITAYGNVLKMDPNNLAARNLVQGIMADRDPGRALMDWHEMSGGQTPRAMGAPRMADPRTVIPSLNSQTPGRSRGYSRAAPQRSSRYDDTWMDADGNSSRHDHDIYASVWR